MKFTGKKGRFENSHSITLSEKDLHQHICKIYEEKLKLKSVNHLQGKFEKTVV
jgi:hypothetical protein